MSEAKREAQMEAEDDMSGRYLISRWGAFLVFALNSGGVAEAHEPHVCPADFPDQPALKGHVNHDDIVAGKYTLNEIIEVGRQLFTAKFNACDGQGRPAATGTGTPRVPDQPAFIRTSAPDSNSCAGCHNDPRAGGGGDFTVNAFVLAQSLDPVTHSVAEEFSNERNTLGMFGAGAIEMLAIEMSQDLQFQAHGLPDGQHTLTTKGVEFGVTISGGKVVKSQGIDPDLVIKPFHQSGVVVSLREFSNNAFNHHHGMQSEERFDLNDAMDRDPDMDGDGYTRELSIGDITAAVFFQASLGVPGRLLPVNRAARAEIAQGEALFSATGCASCHIPEMKLDSRFFTEPNPFNPFGNFRDQAKSIRFDMTAQGERPRLEGTPEGGALVRAFTDLKRHNLCDPVNDPEAIRHFCNEQHDQGRPAQEGTPGRAFFLTRKLWDVGNSAPYGHRGDLTTITEAILAHGGEARMSRDHFVGLSHSDQVAMIKFLKSLRIISEPTPTIIAHE